MSENRTRSLEQRLTAIEDRKKRGPAPKPDSEVKRKHMTFRILGAQHERLKAAAAAAGRSISEEIEARLARSFEEADLADRLVQRLREEKVI